MVFISAICFKPSKEGMDKYFWKRFKRIYKPVFIFLTFFFIVTGIISHYFHKFNYPTDWIIGSYLLLDEPSIGYVWIMRVFLMIAIILPLLYPCFIRLNLLASILTFTGLILIQDPLTYLIDSIDQPIIRLALNQTVLYIIGYSPFVLLGVKIREWNFNEILLLIAFAATATLIISLHNGCFDPQAFKYPPLSLYIVYGILGCCVMWIIRPLIYRAAQWNFWIFLSKNSMWLYLWHIIPIILITPNGLRPDNWGARYIIVLFGAIILFQIYEWIATYITLFTKKICALIRKN